MKKNIAFLFIVILNQVMVQGQQKIGLESLIPPAPNAAELGKYGTYPVGTLTGIPQISFPLYEVISGSLKLPITLSYHASGVQVNQKSTDIGLGWSIMAGGTISRTVYGAADNNTYGYFNYSPPTYTTLSGITNFYTMQGYSNPGYDLEPDLFAYNMAGKSGKFIYTRERNFLSIPFDPIKITRKGIGSNILFQIVDDNGTIYKFDQYATTSSDFSRAKNTINSWYLTDMISADLTDTISFIYQPIYIEDPMDQQIYPIGKKMSISSGAASSVFVSGDSYYPAGVQTITSVNRYNELLIKQIKFKNGYVQFNRKNFRKDVDPQTNMLDEMLVYTAGNKVIRKIKFNHSYYTAVPFINDWAHYRLKLTGFAASGADTSIQKKYFFDYDATSLPPFGSYNIDYWGFYNGAANKSLIAATTVYASEINAVSFANGESYNNGFTNPGQSWSIGSANREPSATYMKAGILNKITYPTGGYCVFEYEPHKYPSAINAGQIKIGGGLRIRSIKTYASDNLLGSKERYVYGEAENGQGIKLFEERNFYRNYEDVVSAYYNATASQVCYPVAGVNTLWQRKYMGISKYNSLNYQGSSILYSTVTKYHGDSLSNTGKTVYNYNIISDPINFPDEFINSGNYGSVNSAWNQAELIAETNYKKAGSSYTPVSKMQYEYNRYNQSTQSGILVKQYKQLVKFSDCATFPEGPDPGNSKYGQGFFSVYEYPVKTGISKVSKQTSIIYDQDNIANTVSTVTNYQYGHVANRYPTENSVVTSDGNSSVTKLKYPQDMTDAVSKAMVAKNILSPSLEQRVYKSASGVETLLSTMQTVYRQIGNLIVRDNIKSSTGSFTPETRILFNLYDVNGNILEQQKKGDAKQSYIWDNSGGYPLAEAVNAAQADIAYTSFEANEKGNWSFTGTPVTDITVPMGKKAYNLSSGSLTKAVTATTSYFISYWRPSGLPALNITGTQQHYPLIGREVNGWKHYLHKVMAITTATVTGTGLIDELRLYSAGAQMTTYDYEPLLGIKARCDANNRITYYEYDSFNRLILTRDQDRNILKKICYNYMGEADNCQQFINEEKSGYFTRTNCGPGYNGGAYYVMIPPGSFSSSASVADANTQANLYGQDQANMSGACLYNCSFSASTGFSISSGSIRNANNIVSFSLVFNAVSGTTNWNILNQVATVSTACKPAATQDFTMEESGRAWQIIITGTGALSVRLLNGTAPAGTNPVTLSGGIYAP